MSKYDELFEFRLAKSDEVAKIMRFIGDYWPKKNNIFSYDEDFFRSEFCSNGKVDFFLAVNKQSNEIECCIGLYFYTKLFISRENDLGGGMFLANPNCKIPFIGAETLKRAIMGLNPRAYIAPGANPNTSAKVVIKQLKQKISRMKHFYILSDIQSFSIAKIVHNEKSEPSSEIQLPMNKFIDSDSMYAVFDDNNFKKRLPYKDRWYVEKRYFNHPIYQYSIYGVGDKTVLVFREITVGDSKILRIIDILGDINQLAFIGKALKDFVNKNGYEYVDLYELGIPETVLKEAGFIERTENDENVIPNYFEPYICQNVEIYVHHLNEDDLCFKGDGDQDRPNKR